VGVIGVITLETPETQRPSNLKGLTFKDPNPIIAQCAKELKAQGAQIIVLDAHMSTFQNYSGTASVNMITGEGANVTANNAKLLDVSITGHSHQFVNGWVSGTSTFQADWAGKAIDKTVIQFDLESNKVISVQTQVVNLVGSTLPQDKGAMGIYNQYAKNILPLENKVIGYSKYGLSKSGSSTCQIGDWVTDTTRKALRLDVFIVNSGGIRAGISPGPITMGELYQVFPFDDFICTTTMNGAQLNALIEYCITGSAGWSAGYFSGVKVVYDASKPEGERIISIKDLNGRPIVATKMYRVGTIDFVTTGGDGFSIFSKLPITNTGIDLRDLLVEQMKNEKHSDEKVDNRIIFMQ